MTKVDKDLQRIMIIIDSIALGGGAERVVVDTFNGLRKRNFEVRLVYFIKSSFYGYQDASIWEEKINQSINSVLCNCHLKFTILGKPLNNISELNQQIENFTPHIIHSHLPFTELLSRTKIYPNIKYFTHLHDNMKIFEKRNFFQLRNRPDISNFFIRKWLINQYKKCNNHFISISPDTDLYYKKNLPEDLSNNIISLTNAIDLTRFSAFKEKKLVVNQSITLVNVGSLVPKKNQVFLVEVVSILKMRGFSVTLKILGGGDERKYIEKRIKELNLEKSIELQGYTDNVDEVLSEATLYLHSATYEPFGLALVEAMAAGLPIVALDGKGNRELVKNGKTGYMLFENNPELFADKIGELIQNPILYAEMSSNSKELAKEYDINSYVDKLLDIYRN
jgi:glycosyltransferase involved in cell wall biosynthesis